MVGAIVISPTDTSSQEAVVGSAQRVVGARARAPRDAAVHHFVEYLESQCSEFALDGGTGLIARFESVLPEAEPCVAYAPGDLNRLIGIVVDVLLEVYELVRLVVHLARCLYAEYDGGLRHPLRA